MKTYVRFLAFACLMFSFSLSAQNKRRTTESDRLYLEGGPSLVWMHGNPALTFQDQTNDIHLGLGWTRIFYGPLYVHTGLYASRKGNRQLINWSDDQGNTFNLTDVRFRQDYLVVPLLLRVELGDRIRFYGEAGPYGGALLQAVEEPRVEMGALPSKTTTSNYLRVDAGAALGAGIQMTFMDNFCVTLGGRYSHGLLSIVKKQSTNDPSVLNAALDLRLGVGFWLPQ